MRIADCDDLFLRLWWDSEYSVHDERDDRETMLDPTDLFTFSTAFRMWAPMFSVSKDGWWYPPREWPTKKLRELKRRLLPELLLREEDDERLLVYECLPEGLKNRFSHQRLSVHGPQLPHAEWHHLFKIMPVGVPWTRRNRKLVIRALSRHCHPGVRSTILTGLSAWGLSPREIWDTAPT